MRPGLTLRIVGERSFYEVETPGELERIRPQLTPVQYNTGIQLRRLWQEGALEPGPSSSCIASLEAGGRSVQGDDPYRLEQNDRLRAVLRRVPHVDHLIDVVAYDRPANLHVVRAALDAAYRQL